MKSFFTWITAYPLLVIIVCLISTAVFAYGLTKIETEADTENMLPEGHDSVEHMHQVEDIFEIGESMTIAVVNEDNEGIYNSHTLALIKDITEKLEDVRGIDPQKIWSLFTVSDIIAEVGGFAIAPLCDEAPSNVTDIEKLRERIKNNPLFYGSLVSFNGRGAIVNAELTPAADKAQVYYDVRDLLDGMQVGKEQFYVTGQPVVTGIIGKHVEKDMSKMMPLVSVVIVLMLLVIFRSFRGVTLPLAVVVLSVIWAMGLMAFLGIPIYPMSTIVPIVIMAIGVADGIHILTRYNEGAKANPGLPSRDIAVNAMMEMWSPVVMTSLTTTVGFLSLLSSSMKPIFYTGIFTSVGVMAAMIFSLTLIPASLSLMRAPAAPSSRRRILDGDIIFEKIGSYVFRFRKLVCGLSIGVIVFSLAGLWILNVDSNPLSNFNQSDPIPISNKLINRIFAGSTIIHTTLESDEEKRFLDPEILKAVDRFEAAVSGIEKIGAVTSVNNLLKMMHQAMNDDKAEFRIVPPTRNLVGTYLMLYSGENLNHYINYGRDKINVQTRVMSSSTKDLQKILDRMNDLADEHLGAQSDVSFSVGGYGQVLVDIINLIVYGQIYSIILSIIGVFIITAIMFRSLAAGFFNIVPISVATCINFGIMGLAGIPLEPATAITACIGIGVGIDYAIHFIAKYRLTSGKGYEGQKLVAHSMATAGKAIFFNAVVVIGGFLVLLTSNFPPSRNMGLMISLNMFNSFAASATVLPVLLIMLNPAFCRRR